jgi:hypothetical protein
VAVVSTGTHRGFASDQKLIAMSAKQWPAISKEHLGREFAKEVEKNQAEYSAPTLASGQEEEPAVRFPSEETLAYPND